MGVAAVVVDSNSSGTGVSNLLAKILTQLLMITTTTTDSLLCGISLRSILYSNGTVIPPIANGNGTGQQDLVAGVACKSVVSTGYDAHVAAAHDAKRVLIANNNNESKQYAQLQFDLSLRSKTAFTQL